MATRRRSRPEIRRRVKVCGGKGCRVVQAIVDTGATITTMTERLARGLGVRTIAGTSRMMRTAGGPTKAHGGIAKVCLSDRGCGCLTGPVAIIGIRDFGGAEVLIGQDYLEASRAQIDAAKRTLRCRLPTRTRRR